ncbi:MAG: cation-translocating P-type ATPase C-terminal domain-containing protein [Gallionella sp.]
MLHGSHPVSFFSPFIVTVNFVAMRAVHSCEHRTLDEYTEGSADRIPDETLCSGSAHWQTMVFTVLTLAPLVHVMAIRSKRESLFTIGLFSNRPMTLTILFTFMLQMATIYVPALNPIFKTEPLDGGELAICIAIAGTVLLAVEIEKWLMRRELIYRDC